MRCSDNAYSMPGIVQSQKTLNIYHKYDLTIEYKKTVHEDCLHVPFFKFKKVKRFNNL